jgi:hypothetical protein
LAENATVATLPASAVFCAAVATVPKALQSNPGLPDFSWYKIPKREKIYQISTNCPQNITKDRKMDQSVHKIYQHLPLQDPPKFTQIGIFGMKICHLATVVEPLVRAKKIV